MEFRKMLRAKRSADLPTPPPTETTRPVVFAKKPDGRRKPAGSKRTKQFNTKVVPGFLVKFDAAMQLESDRLGREVSRPYFLELLLASWESGKGAAVAPFGLSSASLDGAKAIQDLTGWELGLIVEDALVARARELGVGTKKKAPK